ncbi:hypothetical protein EMCG_00925 [[Emmonsia] crescens]|uniref:Methyltransferase domain-containing protein n=1 Tax=[Emmonsia] crescens TaxID=73230 RepID=A0A0G2HNL4_9EURO|nr:hypothetical protein EMCG_00925 [Emmonsia crescens UAMH 3008]
MHKPWESFYNNSLSHLSSKRGAERKCQARNRGENEANDRDDKEEGDDDDYDSDEDEDDDDDDPGTSWFTEHNAPEKVMRFLTSESFPLAPCNTQAQSQSQPQPQPNILDIGTGNGSMLTLLRDEGGFTGGQMAGVDYSPKSIELARRLHDSPARDEGATTPTIRFEVWDVFDKKAVQELDWFPAAQGGFDIVLDKGTFDAISLSAEEIATGKRGGEENVDRKGSRVVQKRLQLDGGGVD